MEGEWRSCLVLVCLFGQSLDNLVLIGMPSAGRCVYSLANQGQRKQGVALTLESWSRRVTVAMLMLRFWVCVGLRRTDVQCSYQ